MAQPPSSPVGDWLREERLSVVLPIERSAEGVWTQRARYSQPDLHEELVLDVDGPLASVASAETYAVRFVVAGDRNAGKSTLLHAFVNAHDREWLRLTSLLPVLTGTFSNARFGGPCDPAPPRDELPFLDTDVGRCTLVLTREDFVFFCDEFDLPLDEKARRYDYSALEFVELGGDHLDAMIHDKPVSSLHAAALAKSKDIVQSVDRFAYFVNCDSLFAKKDQQLDVNYWRGLVERLHWLRRTSRRFESITLFASRLPTLSPADAARLVGELDRRAYSSSSSSGRGVTNAATVSITATVNNIAADDDDDEREGSSTYGHDDSEDPASSVSVSDDDEDPERRAVLEAVRRDDAGTPLTRALLRLLRARHPHLGVADVRPARHVRPGHAERSNVDVAGLASVLVALFRRDLASQRVPNLDRAVAAALFECAAHFGNTLVVPDDREYVFAPFVSANDFRTWLDDDDDNACACCAQQPNAVPPHLALTRFDAVAEALVQRGLLVRGGVDVAVRVVDGDDTLTLALLSNLPEDEAPFSGAADSLVYSQRSAGLRRREPASSMTVRAPLFSPLLRLLRRCFDNDLLREDDVFPAALRPDLARVAAKLDAALAESVRRLSLDRGSARRRVLWLAEDRLLVHRLATPADSVDRHTELRIAKAAPLDPALLATLSELRGLSPASAPAHAAVIVVPLEKSFQPTT